MLLTLNFNSFTLILLNFSREELFICQQKFQASFANVNNVYRNENKELLINSDALWPSPSSIIRSLKLINREFNNV